MATAQGLPDPLDETAFLQVEPAQARLGEMLFYDPALSGNRNIACATCHAPEFGSADGTALGFGEGGSGLGPDRTKGTADRRQQRNTPGLWNLGAADVSTLFHDGRVEIDAAGQLISPAGAQLPKGLSGVLAAQALFPMISPTEMAGKAGQNTVSSAAQSSVNSAWDVIARRIATSPDYEDMFSRAFVDVDKKDDITIVHIANSLAAFVNVNWRSYGAPFDRYLAGDDMALSADQKIGMALFFGNAGCSECHSGPLFSDQQYHSIGLPNVGPGRVRQFDPIARDVGRMAVTNDPADAYKFRTPFLRNVTITGPYGHNGVYSDLRSVIEHHVDPIAALGNWETFLKNRVGFEHLEGLTFPDNPMEMQRVTKSIGLVPVKLTPEEIGQIEEFLKALTAVQ